MGDFFLREEERGTIGGEGKIVQIDESKFGKRKYNRGRQVEGHWVLGMIEDGDEDFRLALCPDNSRTADVLCAIIEQHIAPGTEIHTDAWKSYLRLPQMGYTHKIVNHSDPENRFVGTQYNGCISSVSSVSARDGTHTQRIESSWRPAKDWFRRRRIRGDAFADTLVEYQWRREMKKTNTDPFHELLSAIRRAYPL